ncbi:5'/3'-nucleotidase SurE [Halolamina litorea]|uniref:5'/3'-nucleotidase SurE n=1 Tax=Halolamina litorea TaxID=1515593 RepID=A0ABD6BQN0_9EURY|nr:5'/3'-nucleotidase SurE [Halolamina litorea]
MSDPSILLTNDDGIDAPGLASLREELTAVGDVTVVAPHDNQSGVGRTRNSTAVRHDHPWGYSLEGTPADCVAYALCGLGTEFDAVVSGVNDGPNAGNYVVGRSGTVGAGIEAAFLGLPAVAVSAYHAVDFFPQPPEEYDFARPARVGADLLERALATETFDEVDLLNVNAPVDTADPHARITRPTADYDLRVGHDADAVERDLGDGSTAVSLDDSVWPDTEGFENPFPLADDHATRYPHGSDRRAMVEGEVSVSPLTVNHGHAESQSLPGVVDSLDAE